MRNELRKPLKQKQVTSGAERVEFVVGQSCGVREGLADIVFFELRQVGNYLGRRHAVRNEIEDMRDRYSKAADCRTA